ncbi:MAG: Xylanase [Acidobacteriaceae bacterium]|nr:Xylanase [Acidobacteriaceae bacterium]
MRKILFTLVLSAATVAPAQQQTLPLWRGEAPDPQVQGPPKDITSPTDRLVAGKSLSHLTNIAAPTLAVFPPPTATNTGAAVVVLPGGGYRILAYDLEGTEVCTWLNSIGVTCLLAQYRVPYKDHFPQNAADLEDVQQAMRLTRAHAAEWHIDPNRIGVLGFSAGGHLAAVLSNHADFKPATQPKGAADPTIDASPNFTILIYPAYLTPEPALNTLAPGIDPTVKTPPTFLLMAENDPVHVENVFVYGRALKDLKVPTEIHVFSEGGHGYGLRPTELPVTHWSALVTTWLHTIHVLGGTSR